MAKSSSLHGLAVVVFVLLVTELDAIRSDTLEESSDLDHDDVPSADVPSAELIGSALVEKNKTGVIFTLAVGVGIWAVKTLTAVAVKEGPTMLLKAIAADLALHGEMKELFEDARSICSGFGSRKTAWMSSWFSSAETSATGLAVFDKFTEQKVDVVQTYMNGKCEKFKSFEPAKPLEGEDAQVGWFQSVLNKGAQFCKCRTGLEEVVPGAEAAFSALGVGGLCDVWDEITMIMEKCELSQTVALECDAESLIAAGVDEGIARSAASYGFSKETIDKLQTGATIGGLVIGGIFAPWSTLSYLILEESGLSEELKLAAKRQAVAMIGARAMKAAIDKGEPIQGVEVDGEELETPTLQGYCDKVMLMPTTYSIWSY